MTCGTDIHRLDEPPSMIRILSDGQDTALRMLE
jgi:hypothetical protein